MQPPPSPRKTRSQSRSASSSSRDAPLADVPGVTPSQVPIKAGHDHDCVVEFKPPVTPKNRSGEQLSGAAVVETSSRPSPRHKFTAGQLRRLEELYQANTHPSKDAKDSLAREIGMSHKSVVIWFQNRRQDRKRKRLDIAKDLKSSLKSSKKRRSVHSLPHPPVPQKTLVKAGTKRRREPFTSQPTDIPKPPPAKLFKPLPVPKLPKPLPSSTLALYNLPRPVFRNPWAPGASQHVSPRMASPPPPTAPLPQRNIWLAQPPRRPSLEWACARSEATRREPERAAFVFRDEDDSAGENSEGEDEDDGAPRCAAVVPAPPPYTPKPYLQTASCPPSLAAPRMFRGEVRRMREYAHGGWTLTPREHFGLLPPDVVLGASLLLELKHSAASPL